MDKEKAPSPGHDNRGRFAKGNLEAKGKLFTRKAATFRKALYDAITADDIKRIVSKLKEQAIAGDLRAIALLFDRVLGTAQTGLDILERLETLEASLDAKGEAWEE